MADETKVKMRIDTREAKSQLRGLAREGMRTAGKVSAGLRGTVGKGLGAVGLGGAIGAGLGAVRGATQSGVADVMGEAVGGLGKRIETFFLGSLPEDARATRSAREETIQAFGAIAGQRGELPAGAKQFFDSVKTIRMDEESGRKLFETDSRFRSKGAEDMVNKIVKLVSKELANAVTALAAELNPFK